MAHRHAEADRLIAALKAGKLPLQAGMTMDASLEAQVRLPHGRQAPSGVDAAPIRCNAYTETRIKTNSDFCRLQTLLRSLLPA